MCSVCCRLSLIVWVCAGLLVLHWVITEVMSVEVFKNIKAHTVTAEAKDSEKNEKPSPVTSLFSSGFALYVKLTDDTNRKRKLKDHSLPRTDISAHDIFPPGGETNEEKPSSCSNPTSPSLRSHLPFYFLPLSFHIQCLNEKPHASLITYLFF
uniref:Uncharacterized protein n=1 Tax=Poecilia reticulata TaxID=8081 RepID=A0A3P9PKS7_POERE